MNEILHRVSIRKYEKPQEDRFDESRIHFVE